MRVSVVIPAYNAGLLLYRSVRSALEQTRAPHEIIVVDDASTDGSIATITRYFPQIRIVSNGINRGAAESRNEGARQATGTAIAFLDADDSWMPEKLERQSATMTDSGAALCLSGFDDLRARRIRWGTRDAQGDFVKLLEAGLPLNTSTLMIDRAALLASGAFDGTLRRGEDVEFYYRMALRGTRACFVGAPLARYHHDNEDSLTSAPTEILRFSALKDRLDATEASPEHRARVMQVLTRHWATRALSAVAKGRRDPAFERDLLQHGAPEALRALRAVVAVAPVLGRAGAAAPLALARSRQQRGRMP